MTDARFPERWLSDRRILRLSDRGFRFFVVSLAWSVSNRTDGHIEPADIDMMPGGFTLADTDELLRTGVLSGVPGMLQITDWNGTQTSRHELEVLENVRRRDREKKARQRARPRDVTGTVPGDCASGTSPGTAQARTGQEGQDRKAVENAPTTNTFGVGNCDVCGEYEPLDELGLCARCEAAEIASAS